MKTKSKKIKYPSFGRHLAAELRSKSLRKAYEKEYARLAIAYEIVQARKQKRMTQSALAKRLGTTQSAIARIEQGRQNVTVGMLAEIAKIFDRKLQIQFSK